MPAAVFRLEAGQRRGPKRRSPRHLALRANLVSRVSVMLLRLPSRFKFVKCAFATSALRCETSVVSHSPESVEGELSLAVQSILHYLTSRHLWLTLFTDWYKYVESACKLR